MGKKKFSTRHLCHSSLSYAHWQHYLLCLNYNSVFYFLHLKTVTFAKVQNILTPFLKLIFTAFLKSYRCHEQVTGNAPGIYDLPGGNFIPLPPLWILWSSAGERPQGKSIFSSARCLLCLIITMYGSARCNRFGKYQIFDTFWVLYGMFSPTVWSTCLVKKRGGGAKTEFIP